MSPQYGEAAWLLKKNDGSLIDRWDVRLCTDAEPSRAHKAAFPEDESSRSRHSLLNFERYRTIVEAQVLSVGERKHLVAAQEAITRNLLKGVRQFGTDESVAAEQSLDQAQTACASESEHTQSGADKTGHDNAEFNDASADSEVPPEWDQPQATAENASSTSTGSLQTEEEPCSDPPVSFSVSFLESPSPSDGASSRRNNIAKCSFQIDNYSVLMEYELLQQQADLLHRFENEHFKTQEMQVESMKRKRNQRHRLREQQMDMLRAVPEPILRHYMHKTAEVKARKKQGNVSSLSSVMMRVAKMAMQRVNVKETHRHHSPTAVTIATVQ
eukprot:Selendium_serpulae@DN6398_c0_g1_i12.p1